MDPCLRNSFIRSLRGSALMTPFVAWVSEGFPQKPREPCSVSCPSTLSSDHGLVLKGYSSLLLRSHRLRVPKRMFPCRRGNQLDWGAVNSVLDTVAIIFCYFGTNFLLVSFFFFLKQRSLTEIQSNTSEAAYLASRRSRGHAHQVWVVVKTFIFYLRDATTHVTKPAA